MTVCELDWIEELRPLEQHPKCGTLNPERQYFQYPNDAGTAFGNGNDTYNFNHPEKKGSQRTWENWQALTGTDYTAGDGGWTLSKYKELKEAGGNDYPIAFPIARVTLYSRSRWENANAVYRKSNPPTECGAPSGYTYVKIAERNQKQGRLYTQIAEWRGFHTDYANDLFFDISP